MSTKDFLVIEPADLLELEVETRIDTDDLRYPDEIVAAVTAQLVEALAAKLVPHTNQTRTRNAVDGLLTVKAKLRLVREGADVRMAALPFVA